MARLARKVGARPHHRQRKSRVQLEWPSRRWLRSLTSRGIAQRRVSCPGASQFTIAANHYREESRQTRIGNRGLKTRVPSTRRNCIPGFSAQLEFVFIRWGSAMDFPDDADGDALPPLADPPAISKPMTLDLAADVP